MEKNLQGNFYSQDRKYQEQYTENQEYGSQEHISYKELFSFPVPPDKSGSLGSRDACREDREPQ